ncbi:MAG: histidinol-phosphatase [SAR324 cluster bacterium]|nr:histidinol-phosphatase [SAR324 cluster bacterium]
MNIKFDKNYHTHTYRCKHASGDVADYCQAAVESGLSVLGISDHTALPDHRWSNVRMEMEELPGYSSAIDQARIDFPELTIIKGMECEYAAEYVSFYQDTLLGELQFDYLVGAAHYIPVGNSWKSSFGGIESVADLRAYANYLIQSMESGLFAFMAHPDLFGNSYQSWDKEAIAASRDILAAAAALRIPLEINGLGMRRGKVNTPQGKRNPYPWLPFWEMAADYDIEVVINSDAHRPKDIIGNMQEAAEIAEKFKLTSAVLQL